MVIDLKRILLVEDNPNDVELTLAGLAEYKLVNDVQGVRGDKDLKLTPVVVLTSSCEEKDLMESYRLGVNAYVVKPVDFHEFVNAVKELGLFWGVINNPPPGSIR